MTLLDEAKNYYKKRKINLRDKVNKEKLDLIIAWLKDEVTTRQALTALGKGTYSAGHGYTIAMILRDAFREGYLSLSKKIDK